MCSERKYLFRESCRNQRQGQEDLRPRQKRQGGCCLNKELFELLNCFELDDLSFLNEVDRHYEHSELTEATLYDRAFVLPESVEDAVLRNMRYEALHNAINKLPETQRRRLILYYFNGLTYSQIAEMEGCKYQTVQDSIYAALNNLKKILK